MRPLYAITADVMYIADLFDEADGNAAEIDLAIDRWLADLEAEQGHKFDSYLNLIRQRRMEAAAARAEKEQWAAKEKACESLAKHLEARLLRHLEATGQTKVTTASGRVVSVQKNGGVQPVEIKPGVLPADVPAEFHRHTIEIDKAAVRAALTEGRELAWAELLPRGNSLRVK